MMQFSNLLFVPGNRPERIEKALASGADLVCIDLEDSVPAAEKDAARTAALAAIARLGSPRLALRINGLATRAGLADLLALAAALDDSGDDFGESAARPAVLLLPMVQSPAEPDQVTAILGAAAPPLVPLIETVRGLRQADAIGACRGVHGLMFGGGDLSAELGVDLAWEPLLAARSAVVASCALNRIVAIDVPWIVLDDEAGLAAECRASKALGFAAKAAIHPRQIATIAAVMRPTPAEIDEARAALAAFAAAGGRAVAFRGRMLEAPVMHRYRRIAALADQTES